MGAIQSKTARFNINDESPEMSIGDFTEGTYSAIGGEHETHKNQEFEDNVIQAHCSMLSAAEDGLKEIPFTTVKRKQDLEDVSIELMHSITTATEDCIYEIGETVDKGINEIENAKENELKSFRSHCEAEKKALQESCSQMKKEDCVRDRDRMIREIKKHCVDTLSYIRTSPLNDNADKSMLNIYVPPYIQLLKKGKGIFNKTGTQVTKYKDLFLTFAKENQRTYIQGEAGTGKTTFATKLALGWSGQSTNASTKQ
ncbi:hypothetical protein DPMN_030988 [Dreissena polymorpha]|uniref:Uncharacterized protein n=1 Tax=Dreissena polymorpha TaxID=45954 RepID=A0A9D4M3P8_DREPO|nr:hypothetical protein DPMN_030988 [Dreissena polymorpha]